MPYRSSLLTAVLIVGVAAAPALAQSTDGDEPEGRQLAGTLFESIDVDGDGSASYAEMLDFSEQVFVSADANDDRLISYEEFAIWDFGMQNIAERQGREQALTATFSLVYDLWDRDNDEQIGPDEWERGLVASSDYADLDGDRMLTRDEFLDGFLTNIAFRSGLRTDR